jgi:transposase
LDADARAAHSVAKIARLIKKLHALRAKHGRIRNVSDLSEISVDPIDPLPSDPIALRAFAADLLERCLRLERLLKLANDARHGRASEKLSPGQLQLALEDIDQAVAAIQAQEEKVRPEKKAERTRERRANRGKLPDHLPRIIETLAPSETHCPCCKGELHEIGVDESQRLDVVPAQYQVIVTRRPKMACRTCYGTVLQSPAPERLIKGGLPTERLVAHVIDAKYHWHLPLYRQAQMMATRGIHIDRSTLAFWVGYAALELAPVWRRLREKLLHSSKICVDETPAPVLDPGKGRTKTGYFWAISRDDRPWQGPEPPGVVYSYAPGRGAVHGLKLLEGFKGVVHCDGYAAYKTMTNAQRADNLAGDVTLAFCWSHLRRQFVQIERTASPAPAPVAHEALTRIAQLYVIETSLRGRSAEERREGRQKLARPLVEVLKAWFEAQLVNLSGKSDTAGAIRYAMTHWEGLTLYLDDGRIEMDTNAVERAMRPIKLTAKNALFAGCDDGAVNWAMLASLIETCKLNDVDAEAWLADVLAKLVSDWPDARIDELLPWADAYKKPSAAIAGAARAA